MKSNNNQENITLYSYYELGVWCRQLLIKNILSETPNYRNAIFKESENLLNKIENKLLSMDITPSISLENINPTTINELKEDFTEPQKFLKQNAFILGNNIILWLSSFIYENKDNYIKIISICLKALDIKDDELSDYIKNRGTTLGEPYEETQEKFQYISSIIEAYLKKVTLNTSKQKEPLEPLEEKVKCDVFISHASMDKESFVEELYKSINKLRVNIFYDKEAFEWGDNWKDKLLENIEKAEFAIIVISENFFGREWTERELNEFLNRQNENGQKLILPILHNITLEQLQEKYPTVADIQALDSSQYSCDEIALFFAQQLIKRLKSK